MRTYTTPTWIYDISGIDMTDATAAYVSIRGSKGTVHKNTVDEPFAVVMVPADNQIACYLTQEESAAIGKGTAIHQVNFIMSDGTRVATETKRANVGINLLQEVI